MRTFPYGRTPGRHPIERRLQRMGFARLPTVQLSIYLSISSNGFGPPPNRLAFHLFRPPRWLTLTRPQVRSRQNKLSRLFNTSTVLRLNSSLYPAWTVTLSGKYRNDHLSPLITITESVFASRVYRSVKTYEVHCISRSTSPPSEVSYILEAYYPGGAWVTSPDATKLILSEIAQRSDVPVPNVLVSDATKTLVDFDYLLLPHPSPAALPTRTLAAHEERAFGQQLKKLHAIDNDWFGVPGEPSNIISWEEAFTLLLETLLDKTEADKLWETVKVEQIRGALSRAIGFFLFDDVEAPSLVWLTGDELSAMEVEKNGESELTFLGFSHAVWGDPRMEHVFMDEVKDIQEGYEENLFLLPRQRIKWVWYSLFYALLMVAESEDIRRVEGARLKVKECVNRLELVEYY